MQSSGASRKRPGHVGAPTTPTTSNAIPAYQHASSTDNNADFNFDFSQPFNADQMFGDGLAMDSGDMTTSLGFPQYSGLSNAVSQSAPSTDLVRRTRTQQLAPTSMNQEQWNGYGGQSGDEDEQELDMKVQMAKRDAQGKRKQIPPFVQKLSSFLDSNNTDLIRWSDDGRSFIVLDEDEFARTLIPELFKHNNYASFVRQLNMYGFHKTVNITDGSLRQSEKARKGVKPPSMYSHPYFRKNRPDLLWLIQKPNSKSVKRKRDGTTKEDSDEERERSPGPESKPHELGSISGTHDLVALPRNELALVRTELQKLQAQQRFISKMIAQLKEQNEQFYRQASTFQALHDRHENSINAILTFLATFYNRSLDGSGAQNLVNMFNNHAAKNQQHGSVVEEYHDTQPDQDQQVQRFVRKPQLLLEAPSKITTESLSPRESSRIPDSSHPSHSPPQIRSRGAQSNATSSVREDRTSASPAIKNDAATPDVLHSVPENDEMMNIINSVNASNATNANISSTVAPSVEFSSALNNFQNAAGNTPLTTQQRNDMLALMATQQGGTSSNNALTAPQAPAMPNLDQFKQTQHQLELLTNMQKQQDERVQELNRRLQPLSPTGSIPGLGGTDENPFDMTGGPGEYDPNSFVNFDDWGSGSGDINFDFGNANNGDIDWNFANTDADNGADMFQDTSADAGDFRTQTERESRDHQTGRVSSIGSVDTNGEGDEGGEEMTNKRARKA